MVKLTRSRAESEFTLIGLELGHNILTPPSEGQKDKVSIVTGSGKNMKLKVPKCQNIPQGA